MRSWGARCCRALEPDDAISRACWGRARPRDARRSRAGSPWSPGPSAGWVRSGARRCSTRARSWSGWTWQGCRASAAFTVARAHSRRPPSRPAGRRARPRGAGGGARSLRDARSAVDVLVNNAGIDQPPGPGHHLSTSRTSRSRLSAGAGGERAPARSRRAQVFGPGMAGRGGGRSSTSARSTPVCRPTRGSTTTCPPTRRSSSRRRTGPPRPPW